MGRLARIILALSKAIKRWVLRNAKLSLILIGLLFISLAARADIDNPSTSGGSSSTITSDTSADTEVLFDNAGTIDGDAGFLYVPGTDIATLVGGLDLAAAGVRGSGADGVLTLLGLGNGADESLTVDLDNGGANVITLASGTAADTIIFSGLLPDIKNGATSAGSIDLFEDSDNGTSKLTLAAPSALAADVSTTLEVCIPVQVVAYTANIPTSTDLYGFYNPYNSTFTVTRVFASVNTAGTTDVITVDINEAGSTILSTKLTIDATENTSATAATAAVISDTSIAAAAKINFDVDDDDGGNTGTGLFVAICGYPQ